MKDQLERQITCLAGTEGEYAIENNEIGEELLQAFFPTPPLCEQEIPVTYN
jgi:hypothetical protein